jgi:hypothetical protein
MKKANDPWHVYIVIYTHTGPSTPRPAPGQVVQVNIFCRLSPSRFCHLHIIKYLCTQLHLQSSTGTRRLEMLNYHATQSNAHDNITHNCFPFFLSTHDCWRISGENVVILVNVIVTSKQNYLSKINNIVLLNASKSTSKRGTLTAYRLDDDRC